VTLKEESQGFVFATTGTRSFGKEGDEGPWPSAEVALCRFGLVSLRLFRRNFLCGMSIPEQAILLPDSCTHFLIYVT
jgi:hypothetical protein